MSVQVTVAVIAAVVALLSALFSAKAARSTAVLQARLQGELEERRERTDKAARLEQVMSRYRDPLLNAAFDLQSRIYNLIAHGYWKKIRSGDEDERSYAVTSTLFVMAQYLAWAEALRRGVQFLASGPGQAQTRLAALQNALIDLLDFLDEPAVRFPRRLRSKITAGTG
jgi:hypothetical protein